MKRRASNPHPSPPSNVVPTQYISTGSTLLDLAISGGRVRGGGIPAGILVEIFGPASCGKTVILCEIAGRVQRAGGEVLFRDPEARLNKQYAGIFGLDVDAVEYDRPATVVEAFKPIYGWKPKNAKAVHGIFADSLAALSTELEMENVDGDKMGMRRAKEFSEQLRKVCRILPERNILMVCSNQVRQNIDAGPYGQKYSAPGGEAIGFYSSLRLRCKASQKVKRERMIRGQKVVRSVGVETEIEVYKSSVWKPYRTAVLSILFDYGVDDIRANLQFIKMHSGRDIYVTGHLDLDKSLEESIRMIEADGLQDKLREEVIDLWEEIEKRFSDEVERKPLRR
jgi:protein RecA